MRTFRIMLNDIKFDEEKEYFDFYRVNGQSQMVSLDLEGMLEQLVGGELFVDSDLREHLEYLSRWTVEAPRKKSLRKLRVEGVHVLTTDELFELDSDGETIIDNLENTGIFAEYFLKEVYGSDE